MGTANGVQAARFFYPDDTGVAWFTKPQDAAQGSSGIVSDGGKYQYEEKSTAQEAVTPLVPHTGLPPHHKPMIAIVIDDMGVDVKRTARAIDELPPTITFSFLPYSRDVQAQTARARAKGHEIIVHMPMQPERVTADPGPDYLGTAMPQKEISARVIKNLSAFTGYDGVNNHMGSKFTCDRAGMETVVKILKKRDLFFLDSKTLAQSVAEDVGHENGLRTTHRDVFIDDTPTPPAVEHYLHRIEYVARHVGSAIAIGHPKDVTLDGLEKWLPTLKDKGFELVPLRTVVALRMAQYKALHTEKSAPPAVAVKAAIEKPVTSVPIEKSKTP